MWEEILNPKLIGAVIGLIVGLVVILAGALEAFILILFIVAGWLIAKFWMGEIDLVDAYERFLESRGRRNRR